MTKALRVLLVDDDEDDYRLTRELLVECDPQGFVVDWAPDYDHALAAMLRAEHDIYLLDYRLGAHTGLDLLRTARQQGFSLPTIMLTGQDERAVDVEAMLAGAVDYLVKSGLNPNRLERSIRYALQQQRHEEDLRRSNDRLEQRVQERTAQLASINVALQAEIAERRRAQADLTDSNQRKDEFLAMLAHELRNPLAPLVNGLEVLRMEDDPEVTESIYILMERQLQKMIRLVDDLLDVSRITRGKIELRRAPVDLVLVAQLAVDSLRSSIDGRGQILEVRLPDVPLLVDGDLTRLEQVLINLLSNASKYTQEGGRISLDLVRQGAQAVIRVADTGVGIAPELLDKIFGLFVQLDRSLDRSQGGLGIGLTLVERLVALHQGTIEAHSAGANQGSEFIVHLPLLVEQPAPTESASRASQPIHPTRSRVMLVDDNVDLVRSLSLLLELKGFDVRTASDGIGALALRSEFRPEAVVLDIGLPGMTGYEVAERLRRQTPGEHLLLVALSGYGREEDRRKSIESGFDLHLVKPVDAEVLVKALAHRPNGERGPNGAR